MRQDHPTTTTKSSQAQIRQKKEQTGAQKNWIPPNARSIVLFSTQFTQQSQEWNKHMKTTNGNHLKPTKESVKWDGPCLPVLQVRGTVRLLEGAKNYSGSSEGLPEEGLVKNLGPFGALPHATIPKGQPTHKPKPEGCVIFTYSWGLVAYSLAFYLRCGNRRQKRPNPNSRRREL